MNRPSPRIPVVAAAALALLLPVAGRCGEPPLRNLTETPDQEELSPSWSPNGDWIAYARRSASNEVDIELIAPDGETTRRLTNDSSRETFPEWSPDGSRIVYGVREGRAQSLWILDLADLTAEPLTHEKTRTHEPCWSPDGKEIAYYGIASGNEQVWSIPADGGEPRRLSFHKSQSWSPAWSPDGSELVYSSYRNQETGGSLFTMPRAGEGEDCAAAWPLTLRDDHRWDRFPDWSPDGLWIVFTAMRGESWDLWIVSADGQIEEPLMSDPAIDTAPSWSPDARRIVFQSDRSGNFDLWIADVGEWLDSLYQERERPSRK